MLRLTDKVSFFFNFNLRYRTIQDPASQRLTWYKPPLTVLVIKKVRDSTVHSPFIQLVQWLIEVKGDSKKNKEILYFFLFFKRKNEWLSSLKRP